jgi:hypothetical protein
MNCSMLFDSHVGSYPQLCCALRNLCIDYNEGV